MLLRNIKVLSLPKFSNSLKVLLRLKKSALYKTNVFCLHPVAFCLWLWHDNPLQSKYSKIGFARALPIWILDQDGNNNESMVTLLQVSASMCRYVTTPSKHWTEWCFTDQHVYLKQTQKILVIQLKLYIIWLANHCQNLRVKLQNSAFSIFWMQQLKTLNSWGR